MQHAGIVESGGSFLVVQRHGDEPIRQHRAKHFFARLSGNFHANARRQLSGNLVDIATEDAHIEAVGFGCHHLATSQGELRAIALQGYDRLAVHHQPDHADDFGHLQGLWSLRPRESGTQDMLAWFHPDLWSIAIDDRCRLAI
ncbi:MAG: hypothetical protein BWZ07_02605 [Alphaproteobacteria bacterium ADurb.BinA280]|jgi:hypothetical protein|nr:MAG: hypothetical protein BWZ07_02605 [Alphaproteobacteria bacterium ADurb.BinA280]